MHTDNEIAREALLQAFIVILDSERETNRIVAADAAEKAFMHFMCMKVFREWKMGDFIALYNAIETANKGGNINAPKD